MTKHIFITGGVVSSLGKGITGAALAMLLSRRGYRVAMQKLDPYLNVDPGTMNPFQHGEVFVTDDGAETDLDCGHYERIAGLSCSKASNFTSGKIYQNVINRERAGGYLGGTVQVIPHITDEIKVAMRSLHHSGVDIAITEIGGTAGDIESLPFLEAARQFKLAAPKSDCIFMHLVLVPYIRAAKELKTKPAQHSVSTLQSIGITPDILICRTDMPMAQEHFKKLSLFCNVPEDYVIEERDVAHSIYEVPLELSAQKLDLKVLELMHLDPGTLELSDYRTWLNGALNPKSSCTIAVVGKYVKHQDAYKSIYEALSHAGIKNSAEINIMKVEAQGLENGDAASLLKGADAILVPGGFGDRGVCGKVKAIEYARVSKTPFLGICLGMQCAVIEYTRNVLGYTDADSTEFNPATTHPVIGLMEDQHNIRNKGGTMRLGAYDCELEPGSKTAMLYGKTSIRERHRHRYEFNPQFKGELKQAGLRIAGWHPELGLVEVVELAGDHPFYVGCQYHPEFKSRPQQSHPLFNGFVAAALAQAERRMKYAEAE